MGFCSKTRHFERFSGVLAPIELKMEESFCLLSHSRKTYTHSVQVTLKLIIAHDQMPTALHSKVLVAMHLTKGRPTITSAYKVFLCIHYLHKLKQ